MKVVILLGLLSVSCARKIKTTTESQEPQIIGGEPTDIKFFPHQLSLRLFDLHICGASVNLSKNQILICIYNKNIFFSDYR